MYNALSLELAQAVATARTADAVRQTRRVSRTSRRPARPGAGRLRRGMLRPAPQ